MRKIFSLLILAVVFTTVKATEPPTQRPNVIIVLSDDQGYGDLSCYGNPVLETPALDKLHNESVSFSNFHVSPQCTPSRGELMSGLDALHNKASSVGAGRGIIRRDVITMPEVFKENGYRTGIFGKWHLGDGYPDRPMDRGFEKCVWFQGWGLLSEAEFDNDYYRTRYLDGLKPVQSEKYCTDLWFDQAMKWMGEMADKKQPFFTYLSLNVTHGPFYSPQEDFDYYSNKGQERSVASFFGMIRNMDNNMARLDKWLEAKHLKDNTILIFMNDNGGTGGITVYNAGMKGRKESNYDGGHRAICFIRWPQGFGKPRVVTDAAEIQDLLPSFIDLLDFKLKKEQQFDGVSLRPVLRDQKPMADRMFVVQFGGNKQPDKYFGCVVWNNWRLVGKSELYDISKDPGQEHDVSGSNPDILHKMQAFYENWWKKVEPDTRELVPVVIGSDKENPVTLLSNDWAEGYVNTQWAVAQGKGEPNGGPWHIYAEKSGKYRLELSRWPFHLNRALTLAGPAKAVGGTKLRTGKPLDIASGCVSLNNGAAVTVNSKPNATAIPVEINIKAGENTLQAWFKDKNGQDVCGAYYVRVTRLGN
ncbi:arylsulfatase [Pedobacter sp. BS3]|uniref:arylsulfatase n=1 Tax=Pedobacter sp. BS3 TaxID=2567937 RepID=UPI0011ED9924|nr:arylsulfatase [Pedobacter sp. BS3]TZF82257.1 arylsulfatase [Pedobacter sp. BS3]